MTNPLSGSAAKAADARVLGEWKLLAPLPDPVGYAGMFGGVLDGQLVVGGGTTWTKPLWLKGEKLFSDRIFSLASPTSSWVESEVKLPFRAGSFASASTPRAIYMVGGIGASGPTNACWKMESVDHRFVFHRLADYPMAVTYAAAAMVGTRLYVAGGQSDPTAKKAVVDVWSLDVEGGAAARWRKEPDLPGSGVFVPAAASDGKNFYVLGGIEFGPADALAPSRHAYRLATGGTRWEILPELPEARVGPVSPCPLIDGKLVVVGGYAEVFPGAPREHPGFSAQTFLFDVAGHKWMNGTRLPQTPVPNRDSPGDPGPAPMIGAPGVVWAQHFVVIGGEVRASVRTPAVLAAPILR